MLKIDAGLQYEEEITTDYIIEDTNERYGCHHTISFYSNRNQQRLLKPTD